MKRFKDELQPKQGGFTLLEVLVALTILAVALSATLRAGGQGAQEAADLRQRLLAGWVAENHLALLRANHSFPPLGKRQGEATMGKQQFVWQEQVSSTAERHFRRVEIRVLDAATPDGNALGSLVAYLGQP